jgi:4-amino-4-deoxy-L-arabinose transferase-like glycosyltransferase
MTSTTGTSTTDTTIESGGHGRREGFARGPVLLIAAAVGVVLALASNSAGYFFDELYFLSAGRNHLAWGYLDQPPLVPALAGWLDTVAPGSLVLFRLPVTLAAALTVVLAALVARELGGGRGAQTLAAGAVAVSGTTIMSHWLATYTLDPLWWTLVIWLVVRWARVRDDRLLLVAGVVTGLSLNTKFLVPALWAALLVAVAVCGPRELLRRRALWIGLGIAAVMAVPTLVWQLRNGLPYAQMGAVVRDEWEGGIGFVLAALLLPGIVGTPLVWFGLVRVLRAPRRHPAAFLAVALLGVGVVIALVHGRSYYLLSITPALTALGAVELTRWRPGGRVRRWLAWPAFALSVVALVAVVPVLPHAVMQRLPGPGIALLEGGEATMRPAGTQAAGAWADLPAGQRAHTVIVAQIYPIAAAVDVYGTASGAPLSYSLHRGYGYFTPPPETADSALWVGFDGPDPLRPWFADCRPSPSDGFSVWLCTGRTAPWTTIWPAARGV